MNSMNNERTPFIYIATPWGPVGGGMYKVADYLIQAQQRASSGAATRAELRGLDTRGNGSALMSMVFLGRAMVRLVKGRLSGKLIGVHVNISERLSIVRKGVLMILCKMLGVPVVLHLHAAQLPQFYEKLPSILKALLRWVFSLPEVCIVLGVSAQQFVARELKVPMSKIEIVINGVPEPTQLRRSPVSGAVQHVLFLGNLTERKGVSDLMKALALLNTSASRLKVSLVGGGDVAAYRAKARILRIDSIVQVLGWADQREASQLLANSDVLILPSYDEGLPLVILEALANGVAVICTPVGEIPNVLTDGVNAVFVQPGDVPGMATTLKSLLEQPALREKIERNGRDIYERQFSVDKFFDRVASIHQRCFGVCASRVVEFELIGGARSGSQAHRHS